MFNNKPMDKALGGAGQPITVDRSRCMRMRFDKNECPVCTSNCHAGAILFGDDIEIDPGKCTLCMLCVSECPADCFNIKGDDFFSLLARLKKVQHSVPWPVLGCKAFTGVDAHEKTACLGALSEEHLIAIHACMDRPVQLNLTACTRCNNSFIIESLKERITAIEEAAGIHISEKIVMVEDAHDLRFQPVTYDRRDFFNALKNMAFLQASGLFEDNSGKAVHSYSQKKLPLKRNILNRILRQGTDADSELRLLQEYAFTVRTGASCDNCLSCIGVCPTGALKGRRDESGQGLLSNPSMCIGCGLCRDFCPNNSVTLLRGYSGQNYFEYRIITGAASIPHEAEKMSCIEALHAG